MKIRLDALLIQKGLVSGREKAKAYIMAGDVYVNSQKADKPGMQVEEDCQLELRADNPKYVSRGGLKLEKAMQAFPLDLKGKICMDIGASTGGFTDCMLQNGAVKVYAVDVGYGQLAWKLREDERVAVMERTNIRHVTSEQIADYPIDFISIDVSFISLSLVLPVASMLLKDYGSAVCLIKPQFEAGKEKVGKKGVVRDPSVHAEVIKKVLLCAREHGFSACGLDYSPVRGPQGNIEYLLYLIKTACEDTITEDLIGKTVENSHMEL